MPVTFTIDPIRKLVISKASGVLTAPEMFAHQASLRKDPLFRPDYAQLADLTQVTEMQVKAEDVRAMAKRSPFRAGARRALVVPRPALFGLARMFDTLTEDHGVELRLFEDLTEASNWLGLET